MLASPYTLENLVKSSPIYQKRYDPKTKKAYVSNTQTGKEISFDAGQGQQYGIGALGESGSHTIDDPGKLVSALSASVQPNTPTQSSTPTQYNSPYSDKIGSALAAITNRPSFNYDPASDVGLKAAQTNAMDAVSRSAARRNMLYSDSNKAQMGQSALALVPQFEQTAYGRYADEGNNLYNQLNALSGLENTAYGQYHDSVGDQQWNKTFDYNAGQDTVNRQERTAAGLGYVNPYSGSAITPEIQAQLAPYAGDYQAFINTNPNSPLVPYAQNARFQKLISNPGQYGQYLQPYQSADVRSADRNYDRGILESDRNYNRGILESDRDYGLAKQKVAQSGSSNAGPSTAGERKLQATSDLFNWGINAYETQKAAQWKDYQSGKTKDYPSPLYSTVEAFLTNPALVNASMSSGADRLKALDDLIRTYAGQSPDEYFKQGRAAKLKPLYESLALRYSQQQGDDSAALAAAIIGALVQK